MKIGLLVCALLLVRSAAALQWELIYTGESYRVLAGGVQRDSGYPGNLDWTAQRDVLNCAGTGLQRR